MRDVIEMCLVVNAIDDDGLVHRVCVGGFVHLACQIPRLNITICCFDIVTFVGLSHP